MSYSLDWSLLRPLDPAGAVQSGFNNGLRTALTLQEHEREGAQRNALAAAINPETGAVDPVQARRAFAINGDTSGLQTFENGRRTQEDARLDRAREDMRRGARILRELNPQDQASWDRALSMARSAGIDVSQVPTQFDPAYRDQIIQVGEALETRPPAEPTARMRELSAAGIQPGTPEFRDAILRNNDPLVVRNDDGTITLIPRPSPGAMQPQAGGNRPLTDAEIEAMENGGTGRGQSNFPAR